MNYDFPVSRIDPMSDKRPSNADVILLAEDNDSDAFLLERAFKQLGWRNTLRRVRHGEDAIAYLSGTGKFQDRNKYPLPSILLLDLSMPVRDGFAVLQWIQRQGPASMGIIVLTDSNWVPDIDRAREFGADSFLTKPIDFTAFAELVREVAFLLTSRPRSETRTNAKLKSKTELLPAEFFGALAPAPHHLGAGGDDQVCA